jgi:hypothetical protein
MAEPDKLKASAAALVEKLFGPPQKANFEAVAAQCPAKFRGQVENGDFGDPAGFLSASASEDPIAAFFESVNMTRTEGASFKAAVCGEPAVLGPNMNQLEVKVTFVSWLKGGSETTYTDLVWLRDDNGCEGVLCNFNATFQPEAPTTCAASAAAAKIEVKTVRKFASRFTIASRLKHIPSTNAAKPDDLVFVHAPQLHGHEGGTQSSGRPEFFLDVGLDKPLQPLPSDASKSKPSVNCFPSDQWMSEEWPAGVPEELYGISAYNGLETMAGVIVQLKNIHHLVCVHDVRAYRTRIIPKADPVPPGWEEWNVAGEKDWNGTMPIDWWPDIRAKDALDVEQCDANRWPGDAPKILAQLEAWGWLRKAGQPDYAYAQFLSDKLGSYEKIVYDAAKDNTLNAGKPPSVCMANGVAECRRFSIIMVACLRVANIQARLVYNCMHCSAEGYPQWAPQVRLFFFFFSPFFFLSFFVPFGYGITENRDVCLKISPVKRTIIHIYFIIRRCITSRRFILRARGGAFSSLRAAFSETMGCRPASSLVSCFALHTACPRRRRSMTPIPFGGVT